jgi:hypothetical protein
VPSPPTRRATPSEALPSVHLPPREIDAEADPWAPRPMTRAGGNRAMFSKPLAHPSTLDRPPTGCAPVTTSYVEGLWSPSLVLDSEKWQAKAHGHFHAPFNALSRRSLSLSGGASIRSYVFFKLGITSRSYRFGPPSNDEGDPLGRPRLARNAARELACTPPSEGSESVELEAGTDVLPRRDRCD